MQQNRVADRRTLRSTGQPTQLQLQEQCRAGLPSTELESIGEPAWPRCAGSATFDAGRGHRPASCLSRHCSRRSVVVHGEKADNARRVEQSKHQRDIDRCRLESARTLPDACGDAGSVESDSVRCSTRCDDALRLMLGQLTSASVRLFRSFRVSSS